MENKSKKIWSPKSASVACLRGQLLDSGRLIFLCVPGSLNFLSHQGNISGGSDYMFIPPVMRGLKNYRTLKKR